MKIRQSLPKEEVRELEKSFKEFLDAEEEDGGFIIMSYGNEVADAFVNVCPNCVHELVDAVVEGAELDGCLAKCEKKEKYLN